MSNISLGDYLLNNLKKGIEDDIIEVVSSDNISFKIHKCIARKSELLSLLMDENNSIKIQVNFDHYVVDLIKQYFYSNKIRICKNNFEDLLRISDYLGIECLFKMVADWIIKYNVSTSNAFSIMKLIKSTSRSTSYYSDNIEQYIKQNIQVLLVRPDIKNLNQMEYFLNISNNEIPENIIFESLKIWIKNKNNKNKIIQSIINEKLLIPGLIDTSILWSDFLPFMQSVKYSLTNNEILNILELSNFKGELRIQNKKDYYKYLWASKLNINDKIEIRDCFNRWNTGEIYYMETKKGSSRYLDTLKMKIKTEDNLLEEIFIPNDIKRLEKIYTHTSNWRIELKESSNINYNLNQDSFLYCKIIFKIENDIILYSNDGNYYKSTIKSKKISKPSDFIKYNTYMVSPSNQIEINLNIVELMRYDLKYTYQDLEKLV